MNKLCMIVSIIFVNLLSQPTFAEPSNSISSVQKYYARNSIERLDLILNLIDSQGISEATAKSRAMDEVAILEAELLSIHGGHETIEANALYHWVQELAQNVRAGKTSAKVFFEAMMTVYSTDWHASAKESVRREIVSGIRQFQEGLKNLKNLDVSPDVLTSLVSIKFTRIDTAFLSLYGVAYINHQDLGYQHYLENTSIARLKRWTEALKAEKLTFNEYEDLIGSELSLQELLADDGGVEKGN